PSGPNREIRSSCNRLIGHGTVMSTAANARIRHESAAGTEDARRLFHIHAPCPVGKTMPMQANRTATVLFAEPNSGTKRSEASRKALAEAVGNIAESTGGRLVKTIGGKLMVVFASPDAAASAASRIQAKIDALAPVNGVKLGVQIAFHSGPVVRGGVADDTVKLALRLVEQAHD